jgi:hypothetical protein
MFIINTSVGLISLATVSLLCVASYILIRRRNKKKEALIAVALETPEGREALALSMIAGITPRKPKQ